MLVFRGGGVPSFLLLVFRGSKRFANFSPHRLSYFEDTIAVNSLMKEMPWREVSWGIMGPQEMMPHGSEKYFDINGYSGSTVALQKLGGGFKYSLFSPLWGRFPTCGAYFSDGLVQPPTRKVLYSSINQIFCLWTKFVCWTQFVMR